MLKGLSTRLPNDNSFEIICPERVRNIEFGLACYNGSVLYDLFYKDVCAKKTGYPDKAAWKGKREEYPDCGNYNVNCNMFHCSNSTAFHNLGLECSTGQCADSRSHHWVIGRSHFSDCSSDHER